MKNRDRMNILININTVLYFKPLYLHKAKLVNFFFFFFTIYQSSLPLSYTKLTNARNNADKQEPLSQLADTKAVKTSLNKCVG